MAILCHLCERTRYIFHLIKAMQGILAHWDRKTGLLDNIHYTTLWEALYIFIGKGKVLRKRRRAQRDEGEDAWRGREGGPEQRGLGTTLKLFLDPAISGAINLSRCGCRSHARASSARCTPRGRRGGGLVNPIVLGQLLHKLNCLIGHKSRKSVGISIANGNKDNWNFMILNWILHGFCVP